MKGLSLQRRRKRGRRRMKLGTNYKKLSLAETIKRLKEMLSTQQPYMYNDEAIVSAINYLIKGDSNVSSIPDGATNGDMIKAMFPGVEITEIRGSFDEDKLLGYRTWLGGRSQDYLLDWWNAPYEEGHQDE